MKKKKLIINICWFIIWLITVLLIILSKTTKDTKLVMNNGSMSSTIVYDATHDKICYQNNIHERMLPASLTKILTALTAYENLELNKVVKINNDIISAQGSRIYLEEDDIISVEQLLYGMILQSGNDASLALQYAYSENKEDFIVKMNEIVKRLDLKNSHFTNSTGLDETDYNYTSTYDFAVITKEAIKYEYLKTLFGTKKYQVTFDNRTLFFKHKHRLLFSEDFIIGGKTGVAPVFCEI